MHAVLARILIGCYGPNFTAFTRCGVHSDPDRRIFFNVIFALATEVGTCAFREINVVANNASARQVASRNSGNVLSPAWSVRNAATSATLSNRRHIHRAGHERRALHDHRAFSSQKRSGCREETTGCGSRQRAAEFPPDTGSRRLLAGQPSRVVALLAVFDRLRPRKSPSPPTELRNSTIWFHRSGETA